MSRATNDLAAVRMMLGPGIMYLVNTAVVALVSIGFMLAISPRVTLYALMPLPLVSLSRVVFRRAHPPALRGHPAALRGDLRAACRRTSPACAWCAPSRASGARSRNSDGLNQDYLDAEPAR